MSDPDPPHDRSRHKEAFLVRQMDGQGTRLPDLQRHIAREFPPVQRNVPDGALSLEQASVVRDGAVNRGATVGTNREGHGSLTGKLILGGVPRKAQEPNLSKVHQVVEGVGEPYTYSHAHFTPRSIWHLHLDLQRLARSGVPTAVRQEHVCSGMPRRILPVSIPQ